MVVVQGRLLDRFPTTSPRTRDRMWPCGHIQSAILLEECPTFALAFKTAATVPSKRRELHAQPTLSYWARSGRQI
jgi:hypothetical protein